MNIRKMTYVELDEFLNKKEYLTEQEFIDVQNHKLTDDITFWTRKGNIREYTVEILKDNLNPYSDVDIFVKEEEV